MSAPEAGAAEAPLPPVARPHDVSLRYGRTRALDAVTLDLPAGRMCEPGARDTVWQIMIDCLAGRGDPAGVVVRTAPARGYAVCAQP